MKENGNDPIILDAGDVFFSEERAVGLILDQSVLRARTLVDGYNAIGCDALNIGAKDFAGGLDFLMELREAADFPFISANIIDASTGELVFEPYAVVERGDFRFGVIGLTTALTEDVENLDLLDPVEQGRKILTELSAKTDYQVVLFNGSEEEAVEAKNSFREAEFVFLSGDTRNPTGRTRQPVEGPKLYRLGKQGKSLATVYIDVEDPDLALTDITHLARKEKFISRQLDRMNRKDPSKSLEEIYKEKPRVLERIHQIKTELSSVKKEIAQLQNTVEFDFVPMTRKIGDDPTLLAVVNETLSACSRLADGAEDTGSLLETKLGSDTQEKKQSGLRGKTSSE